MSAQRGSKLLPMVIIVAILIFLLACAKSIQVHPSHYAASLPGGKIDKKVAVLIPNTEKYKEYTYDAWWAGWSADIELGEALEAVSMQTASSLYKDVYLIRQKSNANDADLIFAPSVTYYRHHVPMLFSRFVPHTATITIHVTLEDSKGKLLINRDYKGKDSKSMAMDINKWPVMQELAEKVFEQTFEIIESDLKNASKD